MSRMLFVIGYFGEPGFLLSGCAFLQAIRRAECNNALGNKANERSKFVQIRQLACETFSFV